MAIESITKTLGAGSGIDLSSLVTGLIEAQYGTKAAQLATRSEALTAQISGVGQLKGAMAGFDTALKTLVGNGTLGTALTSSNPEVVAASRLDGAAASKLSAKLTVAQLAAAQAATTNTAVSRTAQFKTGTLQLRIGTEGTGTAFTATQTASIAVTAANATIDGIAEAINAAKDGAGVSLGLTATVIADGAGFRLSVKGQTGAAKAFQINATDNNRGPFGGGNPGASLSTVAVNRGAGTGTTIGVGASDAKIVMDGATYTRPTNTVDDLVAGVRLDLKTVSATAVTLSATTAAPALSQAVGDFVTTYNEMLALVREQTDPVTGPLRSDPVAVRMRRSLAQLTTQPLVARNGGAPTTLAELGVATARDGTLSVDTARLKRALETYPDTVGKMFAAASGTATTNNGLSAALSGVAANVTSATFGLGAQALRYGRAQAQVADAQEELTEARSGATERMTRQFATMDTRVAAYKSVQTFLTGQIAAWNKSDG